MLWDLGDLVCSSMLAKELGVVDTAISRWRERYEDFPVPLDVPGSPRPLFSRVQVMVWYEARLVRQAARVAAREASRTGGQSHDLRSTAAA